MCYADFLMFSEGLFLDDLLQDRGGSFKCNAWFKMGSYKILRSISWYRVKGANSSSSLKIEGCVFWAIVT